MPKFTYDPKTKLYHDEAGRAVSGPTLVKLRDDYLDDAARLIDDYAANLESGAWTIGQFEDEMRLRLKRAYISEYVLGRGGAGQMTQADWGRIGNVLRRQYGYLRSFLDDVEAGKETRGTAANRARNFLGSARQAFSRGRGRAFGFDLPYHPGDGGTPCHGNCRCHWSIEETAEEWRAYWRVGGSEPCVGCISRSAESAPYVQLKPKEE